MRVIPAVDVLDGAVVRLVEGDYRRVTSYGTDPTEMGRRWIKSGAELIHLVDLDGARSGDPDRDLWRRFAAAGIPFQVGGGVRSASLAREALHAGAARVVLGTAAVTAPDVVGDLMTSIGPERLVAAVDVRHHRATTEGWQSEGGELEAVVGSLVARDVRLIMVTAIRRDGTMAGPDLDLLTTVQALAPGVSLIASGGVADLEDLMQLADAGMAEVVVGRALYEGRFTLEQAVEAARR